MIANLTMYQRPQLAQAHDRYWALIRANLQDADIQSPEQLSQDAEEFDVWNNPELVLSQTCGMPYRIWLHDKVELIGTPDYGLTDCPPGYYRSAIIVRATDFEKEITDYKGATFAYNQTYSQSGFAAPYWHFRPRGHWFENLYHSEGHVMSAKAVAEGRADIAALDAVSWRLMQQYEPFAKDLAVLEWTKPTPGLPLITAKGGDADAIFGAVEKAIAQLADTDRILLGLKGIVKIAKQKYLEIPNPPDVEHKI